MKIYNPSFSVIRRNTIFASPWQNAKIWAISSLSCRFRKSLSLNSAKRRRTPTRNNTKVCSRSSSGMSTRSEHLGIVICEHHGRDNLTRLRPAESYRACRYAEVARSDITVAHHVASSERPKKSTVRSISTMCDAIISHYSTGSLPHGTPILICTIHYERSCECFRFYACTKFSSSRYKTGHNQVFQVLSTSYTVVSFGNPGYSHRPKNVWVAVIRFLFFVHLAATCLNESFL